MIMGANIGTSVTNTIVSIGQMKNRGQFELAFAGATVHDMFNFLTVAVMLPVEVVSGCLYRLTSAIVDSWSLSTNKASKFDLLKKLTRPLTSSIVQIDKKQVARIARGNVSASQTHLLKRFCGRKMVPIDGCGMESVDGFTHVWSENDTDDISMSAGKAFGIPFPEIVESSAGPGDIEQNCTKVVRTSCKYLFANVGLPESAVGTILLLISLAMLCISLVLIVKILSSLLEGKVAKGIRSFVNSDLPGPARYFTGYVAILIGAGLTILVQSSSVFTSALTPLVGLEVITLERMYPLTLGSNIGTTVTGILAALASSNIRLSLQVGCAAILS